MGAEANPAIVVGPCGEGAHPHTIKKELNCLRGTLEIARRRGEYALDPRQVLPKWKAHYAPRKTVHTQEQARKLLAAITDAERRALVAYAYGTGARRGELLRARPRQHVRLEEGEVFLDGMKTKGSLRTIPESQSDRNRCKVQGLRLRSGGAQLPPRPSFGVESGALRGRHFGEK